jgi:hypothetical protein
MNKEIRMSKRLIAVSITAMMMLFATALSAQVELMVDGGFEDQTAATLDGIVWYDDGGIYAVELDAGTARSGANCVAITTNGEWSGIATDVELVPATEYTLSLWVQGDDIGATGTFGLWNEDLYEAAVEVEEWNVNSEDWIELSATFTTPASTDDVVAWGFWFGSWGAADAVIRVDDISLMATATTGVEANDAMPAKYALSQNYPNPFNPVTTLDFSLQARGEVEMAVYDLVGHKVRTLVNAAMSSGVHSVTWDGRNDSGDLLSSGIYFYRLTAGSNTITKKMLFLK